jgi:hypothetical protein
VGLVVHAKHFADHSGIAAEAALPIFKAEEKDGRSAWFFVIRGEIASDERLDAENVKEIPGDYTCFYPLGFGAA